MPTITQTHQTQSFHISRELQAQLARILGITLTGTNLPKGSSIQVSLNGGAIHCIANGYSSIRSPHNPIFLDWFQCRVIGTPITVSVSAGGTLLIDDIPGAPIYASAAIPAPSPTPVAPHRGIPPLPTALPRRPCLIPPAYPNPISTVYPHGTLAIPDLPWVTGTPPLILAKMGSFRSMFTNVSNAGYGSTLQHYLPRVGSSAALVANDINVLETGIMKDIGTVISSGLISPTNPLLLNIAVGIQFWGGNTGQQAFTKGGGFTRNCPFNAYANLINLLLAHPTGVALPGGNWPAILGSTGAFTHMGVAFLTKHLSFWSRALGSPIRLPILDSIVKEIFIDPSIPLNWADYVPCRTTTKRRHQRQSKIDTEVGD